jgi:hypothetical protein
VNADVPLSIVTILLLVVARAAISRALVLRERPEPVADGRHTTRARG